MATSLRKKKAKPGWNPLWCDKENLGWELLRKGNPGKAKYLWFTVNSPDKGSKEWRFYKIRTSPHSVEIVFKQSQK